MLEETHIHTKSGGKYGIMFESAQVQVDDVWHPAVIYRDLNGIYCRTKKEFDEKFTPIPKYTTL